MKKNINHNLDRILNLGTIQFSLLLMFILIILPLALLFLIAFFVDFSHHQERTMVINILLVGFLLSAIVAVIISTFIKALRSSRQQLSTANAKLKEAHKRDIELTQKLKRNIKTLDQEIATRKHAEEELDQKASLLRTYIDASPDIIFLRNEKSEFTWCNNSTSALVGYHANDIIGLTPADVYAPDIAKVIIESDEKVLRYNTTVTTELWLTYPNGHKAFFEVKKMPFYDEKTGTHKGLIGYGRDITEHKRNKSILEKENREKMTFISIVSHELRTSLNAIMGLSRILLDMPLPPNQRQYQETIYSSAVMLNVLINDIIELNRIDLNKITIDRKPTEKKSFVSNLTNIARVMVKPKALKFSIDIDESCPPYLLIDAPRLNQILSNILHNAVKFTRQGEIRIRSWYDAKRSMLYFNLCDTGIGIPKSEIGKIFTMYYRVQNSQNEPGTGIGLAISKTIAQAMQGDIVVESEVNKGSCFTVSLYAPMTNKAEVDQQTAPFVSLHILLVEDIPLNVLVAKSVLEKLGHVIHVALTGKSALDLFKPNTYDLILLDIQLPDISGLDVSRQLHAQYKAEDIPPIVAFTANAHRQNQEYFDAGIDDIMTKPLSIAAFNKIVDRFWPSLDLNRDTDPFLSLHFLIVDDVELNITIAKSMLENLGHTLEIAHNGKEALDKFALKKYDAIFLDMNLPDMSGHDIVRMLNQQYAKEILPKLIAFTADAIHDKQDYLAAGFDDVLAKPLEPQAVKTLINYFWQSSENTVKHQRIESDQPVLNLDALQQYFDLVGPETLLKSADMFEQVMPIYIDNLGRFLAEKEEEAIRDEAHKIKGAAGSLGLSQVQNIAKQLQSAESPAWQENVQTWVDEIKNLWQTDLNALRDWVKNHH